MATSTTTPVSVASGTSAGAAGGSVIDVSSLVSQLVTATQAPQQALITNQTNAVTANISALGTLKGALSTFQGALTTLATPSAFNSESAGTSDSNVFTAIAAADAVGGSYSVSVSNLASAQQIVSKPIGATLGTGTLQLGLGTSFFSVSIDSHNNTPSGIAAAINQATNNPGVTATVLSGTDGSHLLLSSSLTGAANTISVHETDVGGALTALNYGVGGTTNYNQNSAAADASFSVGGVPHTSASNTVSDAISGVTLTLLGTTTTTGSGGTTDTPATLTISNDTTTVQKNISAFVDAYNTLHGALTSLGGFDPSTNTAGAMLGNPVLTGIQNQIQHALNSLVGTSAYNSLPGIGITTQNDGTLTVNSSTLQTALASNFSAVSQLFSSKTGVAANLNSQITSDLASGNSVDTYSKSLVQQENALTQKSDDLATQMSALTASLTHQYSVLDSLLSQLQSTSSYLTQAFASLPTVQGKSNA
jgi:flagellar hook-associated protein 2